MTRSMPHVCSPGRLRSLVYPVLHDPNLHYKPWILHIVMLLYIGSYSVEELSEGYV